MASRKQGYAAVAMKPKVQRAVERLAKRDGRQFTRQAEMLLEMGLAEYGKRVAADEAAKVRA